MGRGPLGRIGQSFAVALLALGGLSWNVGATRVPAQIQTASTNSNVTAITEVDPDAVNTLQLSGLEAQFRAVAEKVSPSVVAVSAAVQGVDTEHAIRTDELNTERLAQLLDRTTRTVGTGFVISEDGYIVTNEHVVGDAQQLWVTTDDRKVYPAIVIASDPRGDLAVLKIPATGLKPVTFAEHNEVRRGQWVIALGNPYGLAGEGEMAMSVGLVSAINRGLPKLATKENRLYQNLIQTTAEINPGNSGGPLFDLSGRVIGVNTAVVLPQKNTFGIGFALPVTPHMLAEIENLKQGKEVVYGYVGVSISTATSRERQLARLSQPLGVRVDSVEANSPASAATLHANDLIVQIADRPVPDSDAFVRIVGQTPVDQPTPFTIYRDGQPMTLPVTLRRRPMPQVAVTRESQRFHWNGMLLGPVPSNWEPGKQRPTGLMVLAVDKDSRATTKGIAQGSIISAIAGKTITCIADLQQVLNSTPAELCTIEMAHDQTVVTLDQSK
jgi:serine protease Do